MNKILEISLNPVNFGKPKKLAIGLNNLLKKSSAPDSRKIPTAVINPTNVGKIVKIICAPSFAPSVNAS